MIKYTTIQESGSGRNPHANANGQVIMGQMREFYAWEWTQELFRRKMLTADAVARLEKADEDWINKMKG